MGRARDIASSAPGTAGKPFAVATGICSANSNPGVTVTFPSGRFSQIPIVTSMRSSARGGFQQVEQITTTGFTAYSYDYLGTGNSVTNVNWVAIQMTSGASSG